MGRRRLPKLGRKIDDFDKSLMAWAIKEMSIDTWAGYGLEGEVYSGDICPHPYYSKYELNFKRKFTGKPQLPISLIAHWRDESFPCFFYSNLNYNHLILNVDCDNTHFIPSGHNKSLFWQIVYEFLENIGLSKAYTEKSTHGKGTHSYISFDLTESDWFDQEGKRRNYQEQTSFVKKIILEFQEGLRSFINFHSLPLHVDLLGLPAEYASNGEILTTGTLVKLPFGMNKRKNRIAFSKRQRLNLQQLDLITKNLIDKYTPINNCRKEVGWHGSLELPGKWHLVPEILGFFKRYFGDSKIPFHKRSILSANEFADYLIAIETAYQLASKNKSKEEYWKNTVPINLVMSVFSKNKKKGFNYSSNQFDHKKFRFIFSFCIKYKIINPINLRHSYQVFHENGECSVGIARKWEINNLFDSFFAEFLSVPRIKLKVPGYSPYSLPQNKRERESIIAGNRFSSRFSNFVTILIVLYRKIISWFKNGPKFYLRL